MTQEVFVRGPSVAVLLLLLLFADLHIAHSLHWLLQCNPLSAATNGQGLQQW